MHIPTVKAILPPCDVAVILGDMIERAAEEGVEYVNAVQAKGKVLATTRYDGKGKMDFGCKFYLQRWVQYGRLESATFIAASIYLDRFVERTRVCVTHYNKFRLLLSALVAAEKFLSDGCLNNVHYARIGGVNQAEMNVLEMQFLRDVDFDLFISKQDFAAYRTCFAEYSAHLTRASHIPAHPHGSMLKAEHPQLVNHASNACTGKAHDARPGSPISRKIKRDDFN